MEYGTHCSLESCFQLDFLPFTCTGCKSIYCQNHRFPDSHNCPSWSVLDKTMIFCRKCGSLIFSKDIADSELLSKHLDSNCTLYVYESIKTAGICSFKDCVNKCWMIIDCRLCKSLYCIGHRHPKDHDCNFTPIEKPEIKITLPKVALSNSTLKKPSKFNPTLKLMKLKSKATGDQNIPVKDRVYFTIIAKEKEIIMYFNSNWTIGKILDKICIQANIPNFNNTNSETVITLN